MGPRGTGFVLHAQRMASSTISPPEPGPEAAVEAPAGVTLPAYRMSLRESLVESWRSRYMFPAFGRMAIRRLFQFTILGPTWILLHALIDIAGKTFLFGSVLSVAAPHGIPYVLFLLTGMLVWRLFQETTMYGVRSFQRYRKWTREFTLPLLVIPIAGAAQALMDAFIYLVMVVGVLAYYALRGHVYFQEGPRLLFAPLGIVLCLFFGWGLSFILAPLNYRARDIRNALRYVIPLWIYVTPVVYPLSSLHGKTLAVAKLNPMAPIVEMTKYGLIGAGNVGVRFVTFAVASSLITFVGGLLFLNRFGSDMVARPLIVGGDEEEDEEDL